MKKEDLRNGDLVKYRNGAYGLVVLGFRIGKASAYDAIMNLTDGCFLALKDLNSELEGGYGWGDRLSVDAVFSPEYQGDSYMAYINREHRPILWDWERSKPKEMTVDEISALLGYEVKVVGNK